uniref:Uncharacterized protein n=1 Tax=Rhizophora mucronata TaxID=61149 RepID=A0A2P2P1Y6_RHIMU
MPPCLLMVRLEVVKHIQWLGHKMILDLWFSVCTQSLISSKRIRALSILKLYVPTLKSTMKLSMICLRNHRDI